MTGLERELRALEPAWPPTPDVANAIAQRVEQPAAPPIAAPRRGRLRPVLVALLAVAIVAGAVPPVRAAVGRLLGFAGGERVERVDRVPRTGARLDLGEPSTLAAARRQARVPIALPRRLGPPDAVLVGGDFGARAVTLRYGADTVLTQTPKASAVGLIKQIGGRVELRVVPIRGRTGFWIAPGARGLVLPGPAAAPRRTRRTAIPGASVLVWDRGSVGHRLETRRPFAETVAIARSVR